MESYILIVENEPDIADIVRRYLEFEGYATVCAGSCEAAQVACARQLPELIVLDWRLPDIDGDQWAAELRGNPITSGIPIIMMTGGHPTHTLVAEMMRAQIPILIKPFSLDLLLEYVESMSPRQRALGGD